MAFPTSPGGEPPRLVDLLPRAVAAHPERVALRVGDDSVTYRMLGDLVEARAAELRSLGVRPGDRVALSAANTPHFLAVVLATVGLGASVVLISTSWRRREVGHAVELTGPTHLVHDGSGEVDLAEVLPGVPQLHVDGWFPDGGRSPAADPAAASRTGDAPVDGGGEGGGPVDGGGEGDGRSGDGPVDGGGEGRRRGGWPEVAPDDPAVLVFSSGTTGLPKAVIHTHRSLAHATAHWVAALGLGADDRLQITTPPFHILGLLNLLAVAAVGAGVRLHRRFDLEAMLAAIESDGVTVEMAVAPIALALASHPHLEGHDLSSLRYIMWGATPVTPSVAATVTARTGVPFLAAYGASELPVMAANPVDRPGERRLDSVGPPPAGVELRVVDLASGVPLEPGEVGEIQGRGLSLMAGYLPEEATDEAVVDGWYRTGDVGTIDADGWVTITDRVKELIKVKGFQVAPAEVEAVLLGHPAVVDCAVYGVPDTEVGEAVVGAVVVAGGATVTAAELEALVSAELARYKALRQVRFVDAIPRLPSGKVLRRELVAGHPGAVT